MLHVRRLRRGEMPCTRNTRGLWNSRSTQIRTFSRCLNERANRTPNDSLVEYKNEHGEWSSFSATEFRAKVIAIAKG